MLFKTTRVFTGFMLISSAVTTALPAAEPALVPAEIVVEESFTELVEIPCEKKHHGLKPICHHLNSTADHGCIRYVKGFDVTGVVSEVDLTFPEVKDACDCIQACLNRPGTCAAYVWKFSTADSVTSGHRTCTLYSQFNLPADVILAFDVTNVNNSNINAEELTANGNNPQAGAGVSQTFSDINLNSTVDHEAVSGEVWQLSIGKAIC